MFRLPRNRRSLTVGSVLVIILFFVLLKSKQFWIFCPSKISREPSIMTRENKVVVGSDQQTYSYNRESPLIFIGGVPRSGTTLMRAMLDAHPEVRCGQETRVIPRILQLRSHWMKSEKEKMRLEEAGINKEVLNSAISQFCLEIIANHGAAAKYLCNKDPLTLKMGSYVIELFPNSKFLFMVRDGRATVHSIVSRKVTITGFDLTNYRQCMQKWNQAISTMYEQCKEIGEDKCLIVHYEQLVLQPKSSMEKILKFLNIPWNENVLHHEDFINQENGVVLSKVERSSDQVIKPVNLEALTKWVGKFPEDVVQDMQNIAPMLSVLGYNPYENPPNYGSPDSYVKENTLKLKQDQKIWDQKIEQLLKKKDEDDGENNNQDLDERT